MTYQRLKDARRTKRVQSKLLNGYDGPHSIGVSMKGESPVLVLQVGTTSRKGFPRLVEIDGEKIAVVLKTGMSSVKA